MVALIGTLVLAFILGFAAHRASVCTVRAVAEAMHSQTTFMFRGIGKTMLWIVAVTVPFFLLVPATASNLSGWQLSGLAIAGGFLFGIGAGINGACAYSTMARVVDGEVGMLVAIIGFALGVVGFTALVDAGLAMRPIPTRAILGDVAEGLLLLAAILLAFALYEAWRLWRTRPAGAGLHVLALAPQYRLSTAALVMGLAGAGIFLLSGNGGYTSTFEVVVEGMLGTRAWPVAARWLILVAVLLGMLASTLQRGSFRLDWRPRVLWLRNLAGGALMGLGVALAPGGNDTLVLYSLPSLSPHALPAFAALIVGVVAGLLFMRAIFRIEMRVTCRNDLYVSW